MQKERVNEEDQQRETERGKEETGWPWLSPDLSLKEHFFEPENPVLGVVSRLVTMELIVTGTKRGPPAAGGDGGA